MPNMQSVTSAILISADEASAARLSKINKVRRLFIFYEIVELVLVMKNAYSTSNVSFSPI